MGRSRVDEMYNIGMKLKKIQYLLQKMYLKSSKSRKKVSHCGNFNGAKMICPIFRYGWVFPTFLKYRLRFFAVFALSIENGLFGFSKKAG
jgi:hypothetical protein